jgi:hypothetical protein
MEFSVIIEDDNIEQEKDMEKENEVITEKEESIIEGHDEYVLELVDGFINITNDFLPQPTILVGGSDSDEEFQQINAE